MVNCQNNENKMAVNNERKIRDVRDVWGGVCQKEENKENPRLQCGGDNNSSGGGGGGGGGVGVNVADSRSKHKYKTLERHLSMKKTIRKKMMRDLREIGDAAAVHDAPNQTTVGFLEQIRTDQQPSPNIDKPSLWKRLTKGWGHS